MNQVVLTIEQLRQILRQLCARPTQTLVCSAGVSRHLAGVDVLCQQVPPLNQQQPTNPAQTSRLELVLSDGVPRFPAVLEITPPPPSSSTSKGAGGGMHPVTARLAIGHQAARGIAAGFILTQPGRLEAVHAVRIVGAGCHCIFTAEGWAHRAVLRLPVDWRERWSRTIGALGEDVWRRFVSLKYVQVGVGRNGSLCATSLARQGVQHITLIDPDQLEVSNLSGMDLVTDEQIGEPKPKALAEWLRILSPWTQIETVACSVTSLPALVAIKQCDVVICCSDNDASRLACAIVSSLYLKPMLDVGTGIFYYPTTTRPTHPLTRRLIGADVRLCLPGERCLLCLGGLANLQQAYELLLSAQAEADFLTHRDWQRERAGSLRTLNQVAVHLGLRLLEDLVGERVTHSVWLRLEYDDHAMPSLNSYFPALSRPCPLCQIAGSGEEGLRSMDKLLQTQSATNQ